VKKKKKRRVGPVSTPVLNLPKSVQKRATKTERGERVGVKGIKVRLSKKHQDRGHSFQIVKELSAAWGKQKPEGGKPRGLWGREGEEVRRITA